MKIQIIDRYGNLFVVMDMEVIPRKGEILQWFVPALTGGAEFTFVVTLVKYRIKGNFREGTNSTDVTLTDVTLTVSEGLRVE